MPAILGMRGTGDWGPNERPTNFRDTILWRQPNGMAPLTALMSKMGSESVDDPQFSWWEEELNTIRVENSGAQTAAATTLTLISGGDNLVPGDLLMVEPTADAATFNQEIVAITAVNSDTSVNVTRGVAGTTAGAIADTQYLMKIGNYYAEGSGAPTASTRNPTKFSNYVQIFKTVYDITETAKRTFARTGDPLKNDKKRKMFDHSIALEWAFLFGRASETTGSNGKPIRTTAGLRSFIQTNITIFGGSGPALSEDTFLDAIYPVFNYNSGAGDERLILCGNGAINAINKAVKNSASSRVNFTEVVKFFGMNLQKWVTPQGTFYLKTHPLMNNHPLYTNSMFVIDPSVLKYRYIRDTTFKDNIQAPDADEQKGQWLTEAGLEVHHEKTMAYLGNVK